MYECTLYIPYRMWSFHGINKQQRSMSERYTLFSRGFHAYRIVRLYSWLMQSQVSNSKKIAKNSFTSIICQICNASQGTISEKASKAKISLFCLWILYSAYTESKFVNLLRSPGIDSQPGAVCTTTWRTRPPEPVFVNILRSPGVDSYMADLYDNPICRTDPPCYKGWRNRSIGIDSWAP